jgi:hypothetical protein
MKSACLYLPHALLALALLCPCRVALAQEPDDSTKNAARELGLKAAQAYDAGDYATAQDYFHRAYALVPAPTLSLREARALEKLGRLVEAVEAYMRTVRTPVEATAPQAFQQAVEQARAELEQVRARVPRLRIVVSGRDPKDGLSVTLDGKPVLAALIGVEMPVDPGTHRVAASTQSGARAMQTVTLTESETERATLDLVGSTAVKLSASAAGDSAPTSTGSSQRTWAYVSLGLGGAGLATGVVTGLMAANRHASAEENCPDSKCVAGSSGENDVAAFRSLRPVSTVSYVIGIVGAGAGVTLMLTAPKSKDRGHVAPFVGIARVGIGGRF